MRKYLSSDLIFLYKLLFKASSSIEESLSSVGRFSNAWWRRPTQGAMAFHTAFKIMSIQQKRAVAIFH